MATQFFVHFQALVHWTEAQALAHWIEVQTQIKIGETPNDFLLLIHCIISHKSIGKVQATYKPQHAYAVL